MPKLPSALALALALVVVNVTACETPKSHRTSGGGQSSSADGVSSYTDPGQEAKTKRAFQSPRF